MGTEFEVETSSGNNEILATIDVIASDVTPGAEDGDIVFKTMVAGAAAAEAMRITSGNDVEIADCLLVENEIRLGTNGSASDPGFTWADDDDTGLYRMSENSFAIAAGGAEVLRFSNAEIYASKRLKLLTGTLLFSGADLDFGSGNSTSVKMTLKSDGKFDVPGVYDETEAGSANVLVAADGSLRRATSSRKIKDNIDYKGVDPDLALRFQPVSFDAKADNKHYLGFIAEDMQEIDPRLATGGDLPGLEVEAIIASLTALVQKQQAQIEDLRIRIVELEN